MRTPCGSMRLAWQWPCAGNWRVLARGRQWGWQGRRSCRQKLCLCWALEHGAFSVASLREAGPAWPSAPLRAVCAAQVPAVRAAAHAQPAGGVPGAHCALCLPAHPVGAGLRGHISVLAIRGAACGAVLGSVRWACNGGRSAGQRVLGMQPRWGRGGRGVLEGAFLEKQLREKECGAGRGSVAWA